MVSFSCEVCNDTILKKKLMSHFGRCPFAVFTCIDCNTTFQGNDFQKHTQCISEDQKYQGKLFKGNQNQSPKPSQKPEASKPVTSKQDSKSGAKSDSKSESKPESKSESKSESKAKKSKSDKPEAVSANEGALKFKKTMPLKKALKSLKKSHKLDKEGLLDKIVVTADGRLEWA